MLATGTGVAPFMSLVRGIETYERYDNVILLWSTRLIKELAYNDFLQNLNQHETWGELTQGKFKYYPSVTREEWVNKGRITDAMYNGSVYDKLGVEPFDKEKDSAMICGSMPMNLEFRDYFEKMGCIEGNSSTRGDFVLEKSVCREVNRVWLWCIIFFLIIFLATGCKEKEEEILAYNKGKIYGELNERKMMCRIVKVSLPN